jgi:hypothetical protein
MISGLTCCCRDCASQAKPGRFFDFQFDNCKADPETPIERVEQLRAAIAADLRRRIEDVIGDGERFTIRMKTLWRRPIFTYVYSFPGAEFRVLWCDNQISIEEALEFFTSSEKEFLRLYDRGVSAA